MQGDQFHRVTTNSGNNNGQAKKVPDEIQEKLERAEALRWIVDRGDPHKVNEIADERAALTAELTSPPVIRQLG